MEENFKGEMRALVVCIMNGHKLFCFTLNCFKICGSKCYEFNL